MSLSVQKIVRIAVLSALTISVSLLTKIQPSINLFHLGPIVIITAALLFGQLEGAFIGGLSMGLYDIFFYNPASAPKTIVSYALFGFVVGYISLNAQSYLKHTIVRYISAIILGGIIYTTSYFVFNTISLGFGNPTVNAKIVGCIYIVLATFTAIPLALILKPYVKHLKKRA